MRRPTSVVLAFVLSSPVAGQVGETVPAGAATAASSFDAVCRRLSHGPNTYFSDALIQQVRERLRSDVGEPEKEASERGLLGRELLRQGEIDGAIEQLETAWQLVEKNHLGGGVRSAVHWHLVLAHLQRAEALNCVTHRSAESCIVPIRGAARHRLPKSARRAGDLLERYVAEHPRNIQAVWLLDLARALTGEEKRVPDALRLPPAAFPESEFPEWRDRAPELGLDVADLAGGAAMDDFDGDGLLDLVSSTWDPCGGLQIHRNDGHGGFENVAGAWGLAGQLGGLNLKQVDFDNDGRLDLFVLRGAWLLTEGRIRNSLLRNAAGPDARPRFVDVTVAAGLAAPAYPTQTADFADVDGDGDLDLYVGNEATEASRYPSQLFENLGNGRFRDRAATSGVTNLRYTKGVTWGDADNDGDPDLYVSNFGPNRFYRNDGDWTFVDVAPQLGVTAPEVEGFATWFFDFDNDGDLDLFVGDFRSQAAQVTASYFGIPAEAGQPLLYRNDTERGELRFTEVSRELGIRRPAMPMGANYGDLDNDGWLDFYLGTGEPDLASLMPNQMYRNDHGRGFSEVTYAGRFAHLQKGHGVAFGDIDGDGDQDLFHQLGGFYPVDAYPNALFENPTLGRGAVASSTSAHWVTLRLVGRRANRFGVGARIIVRIEAAGAERSIHLLAGSGGSFGASSLQQEIGLGAAERIVELVIRWPGSGLVQRFGDVPMDRVLQVTEGDESLVEIAARRIVLGGG